MLNKAYFSCCCYLFELTISVVGVHRRGYSMCISLMVFLSFSPSFVVTVKLHWHKMMSFESFFSVSLLRHTLKKRANRKMCANCQPILYRTNSVRNQIFASSNVSLHRITIAIFSFHLSTTTTTTKIWIVLHIYTDRFILILRIKSDI